MDILGYKAQVTEQFALGPWLAISHLFIPSPHLDE